MLVWLTLPFYDCFAIFDPSPLNCSLLHLCLQFYLLPVLSRLLTMSITTTFFYFFQDGGRPLSWFFKSLKFQLLVPFGEPICVIMPNVVPIGQTVAEISQFLDFSDGGHRHLGFLKLQILMVGPVKRVELRHCAKFRWNHSNRGRHMSIFFNFFKMAAVRYFGFMMRVLGPHTKSIWWSLSLCKIWLESMQ